MVKEVKYPVNGPSVGYESQNSKTYRPDLYATEMLISFLTCK